jgi:hypothetical protein
MPASALPQPFSVPLQDALKKALASVPAGKKGWLSLGVTRAGMDAAIGWKPRAGLTISGYGAGYWTRTWEAGVRGEFIW